MSNSFLEVMVSRCSASDCYTNYPRHDSGPDFSLPKDEHLRNSLIPERKKNVESSKKLCEKHFESKYLKKNDNRVRSVMASIPVPTILSDSQSNIPFSLLQTQMKPREEPFQRVYHNISQLSLDKVILSKYLSKQTNLCCKLYDQILRLCDMKITLYSTKLHSVVYMSP